MYYEYETLDACIKMFRDMIQLQPGETVAITTDTVSNQDIVDAAAQACVILGGKPLVMIIAAPAGGKAGDDDMPMKALIDGIKACDVWVEYNTKLIFYSTVYDKIVEDPNNRPRYLNQNGVHPDTAVRNIGKVDNRLLGKFVQGISDYMEAGTHIRITTPAGMDLECDNARGRKYTTADGFVRKGEIKMMSGQIGWAPVFSTINGTMVVDGVMSPPLGILKSPIKMKIENGFVKTIEGGSDAAAFKEWIESFNDDMMYLVAHGGLGFGPNAKLCGDIVEDERVWGCTEWGIGNVGPQLLNDIPGTHGIPAASHTDGICLNCSLWVDGVQILDEGTVVGPTPEFVEMARKLGR